MERITIGIHKSAQTPDIPCYLLAHCRGMVFHFAALDKDNEIIAFTEKDLPAGVIQLILFDKQMNPLSERLVFNKNNNNSQAKVTLHTDKTRYEKRDKVVSTLSLTDSGGNLLDGHLSVAITDDQDIAVDTSTTILSSLLLSSELKGYIENSAYYLQDNVESAIALDYLMLTHGWRRYNVPEVVKGNYTSPQIPVQKAQEISGKVKILSLSPRPASNSEILIMADGDVGLTTTDEKGTFVYANFEYPDSTIYFVRALSKTGNDNVELLLNEESFPKLTHAPQSTVLRQKIIDIETKDHSDTEAFITKAEQRAQYDEDMRVIQLGEIVVTAPRIERKDELRLQHWQNIGSDVTVRRENFEKKYPRLVADILRGIAGVDVSNEGYISVRGGLPLVLIDGIVIEWPISPITKKVILNSPYDSPLEKVTVYDVESIDIHKGASAAIYGVRGSGGVISITTKKGVDVDIQKEIYNQAIYTPLGYQKPVEFYAPKYETLEAKHLTNPDYRTTIFWKPDIVISDTGETSFDFYTSDFPTTYSVVIEGLTTDGRIVRQVEKIQVE